MSDVALATEDEISEAVGERLVREAGLSVGLRLRRNGFGYLKKNMAKWRQLVMGGVPLVLITDLDSADCPRALITEWVGSQAPPKNMVFRVAVREIEAWLLADLVAMQALLGKKVNLPMAPEMLADPKGNLLLLAKRAPRRVRDDLVAEQRAAARQGLGYNSRLCAFVRETWNPQRAALQSPSLARARQRIRELASRLLPEKRHPTQR